MCCVSYTYLNQWTVVFSVRECKPLPIYKQGFRRQQAAFTSSDRTLISTTNRHASTRSCTAPPTGSACALTQSWPTQRPYQISCWKPHYQRDAAVASKMAESTESNLGQCELFTIRSQMILPPLRIIFWAAASLPANDDRELEVGCLHGR